MYVRSEGAINPILPGCYSIHGTHTRGLAKVLKENLLLSPSASLSLDTFSLDHCLPSNLGGRHRTHRPRPAFTSLLLGCFGIIHLLDSLFVLSAAAAIPAMYIAKRYDDDDDEGTAKKSAKSAFSPSSLDSLSPPSYAIYNVCSVHTYVACDGRQREK